ncbi:hypothetical protein Ntsu_65380 [Nocardia sp. IFM 10818]
MFVERAISVVVDRLPWVRAVITESEQGEELTTWRSTRVPSGHEMLAPVTVLTDEPGCERVSEETVEDPEFFGLRATVTRWTLRDVTKGDEYLLHKRVFDG